MLPTRASVMLEDTASQALETNSHAVPNKASETVSQTAETASEVLPEKISGVLPETAIQKECCPDWLRQILCCFFITLFICTGITIGLFIPSIIREGE